MADNGTRINRAGFRKRQSCTHSTMEEALREAALEVFEPEPEDGTWLAGWQESCLMEKGLTLTPDHRVTPI